MSSIVAGSSMAPGANHSEHIGEDAVLPHTWSQCDATSFSLRSGPNYHKFKKKEPSGDAFYEVAGVDFFKCDKKISDIGGKVCFPEEWLSHAEEATTYGLPPIVIVNVQLPSDFSSSFFYEVTDGDGWCMTIYFKIKADTIEMLKDESLTPAALKLLKSYLSEAPIAFQRFGISNSNPWVGRFKLTARIENLDQFGLPSFITAYNAKPVLIRNTGEVVGGVNYVEMDINVHKFGSVPKKALSIMFNRFDQMIISVGFCIESRDDHEMPETLFGCITFNQPSHGQAYPWK